MCACVFRLLLVRLHEYIFLLLPLSSSVASDGSSDNGDSDDRVPSDDSTTDGSEVHHGDGSSIPLCPPSEHSLYH